MLVDTRLRSAVRLLRKLNLGGKSQRALETVLEAVENPPVSLGSCMTRSPGPVPFFCTKEAGHRGQHVATGPDVLARWGAPKDVDVGWYVDTEGRVVVTSEDITEDVSRAGQDESE